MTKPRETKRSTDEAVKAKTGRVWAEWFEILDKAGAKKWPHKEIAAYLLQKKCRRGGAKWFRLVMSTSAGSDRNSRNAMASSAPQAAAR